MKIRQSLVLIVIGIVIGALAAYFLLVQPLSPSTSGKAENTFSEVTAQLDEGGDLYGYLSTDGLVRMATNLSDKIQSVIESQSSDPADRERKLSWFRMIRKMIRDTGFFRIRALGISSRKVSKNLTHTRMIFHRDAGTARELIWNIYAPEPRPLDELKLLPMDTVMAQFGDFRPRVFWDWLHRQAGESKVPEFKKGVAMLEPMLKMNGLEPDRIMKSLSGSAGLIITMDRKRTLPIPMGKASVSIPAPGLAIVLSVRNHDLYDFLASRIPGKKGEPKGNLRRLTIPAPPSPIFPSPTLACNGRYLVFAGEKDLALGILSADPASGLMADRDFERISENMPIKGNGFRFLSPRVGKTIRDIQTLALKNPNMKEGDRKTLKTLMDLLPTDLSFYGVLEHTPTGFRYTANHRLSIHHMVMMPMMIITGISTAVAIPNILTAIQKNRSTATRAKMDLLTNKISARIADSGAAPAEIGKTLDGWGNPFLYRKGPGPADFSLASAGKDGRFSGWEQRGFYTQRGPDGFNRDIIIVNGKLVFGPLVSNR